MRIAFIYSKGRISRLEDLREGKTASEFFYGAIELQERGHQIEYYEIENEQQPSIKKKGIDLLFKCHLLPSRINGSLLLQLIEIRKKLNEVDVVVTTNTGITLGAGTLKTLNILKTPIVGFVLGLVSYKHSWLRGKINGLVLRRIWTQLFGDSEFPGMRRTFNIPKDRIMVNQFGVNVDFWSPDPMQQENYILSVGNDFRRDYDLLLKGASLIEFPFIVVTARLINNDIPYNVTVVPGTWPHESSIDEKLRDWYRNSICLIVPLKDSIQPSGQIVCLQAMACGKLVILTDTKGLWSRSIMRNGENVILVQPGDVDALVHRIQELINDPQTRKRIGNQARKTVLREGNIEVFANRLENFCYNAIFNNEKKSKNLFKESNV